MSLTDKLIRPLKTEAKSKRYFDGGGFTAERSTALLQVALFMRHSAHERTVAKLTQAA